MRWDAIPARSQDILQDIAFDVRDHLDDIRAERILAVIEGAGERSARGERARLSLWRNDGETIQRMKAHRGRDWAASSASALVRLGIFEPLPLRDHDARFVVLTPVGLATIEAAMRTRQIWT